MAQSFLHAGEHGLVVASFKIDHAVACQAGLGDGRSEKVRPRDAPQDLALGAGSEASAEGRSRRTIDSAVAAARYFMQRAEGEAPTGES